MLNKKTKAIRFISIIINILILFFSVTLIILQIIPSFLAEFSNKIQYLTSIIIGLVVISIILNHFYEKYVDCDFFNDKSNIKNQNRKTILKNIKPYKEIVTIQSAREELRLGLKILITVAIIICLYWCFLTKDIWTFIICICMLIIAFVYADYIPHAIFYAKRYDSSFINDDENDDEKNSNAIRGLSRIYLDEFNRTEFVLKNDLYNNINEYNEETNCGIQDECIKNTLYMKAESFKSSNNVLSIIIIFFNVLLVLPGVMDEIVQNILSGFAINSYNYAYFAILLLNIVFASINISTIYKYVEENGTICKIYDAIISDDYRKRLSLYNDFLKKDRKNFEIMRARGIFVFCSTRIDENLKLDNINIKYKMLFSHRYYANKPRFFVTFWLLLASMISTMIKYNIDFFVGIIILIVYIILSILFYYFYLPVLGKKTIKNKCEELMNSQKQCKKKK